jgi:potassium-transporting ATPase KdpC subunit
LSQLIFPRQANGSLVEKNGQIFGSRLIAQGFTADIYFHPRPSAAGAGNDPTSSGSNLGPTNKQLVDRVKQDVAKLQQENPGTPIPADMVITSGSGLDPEISSAPAEFQIARVAKARGNQRRCVAHRGGTAHGGEAVGRVGRGAGEGVGIEFG